MCFSATVSFGAAAVIGAAGAMTLTKTARPSELPLAMMPMVFAAQQAVEGALWLTVPQGRPHSLVPANIFAAIALVLWPLLVPAAIALVERGAARRLIILMLLPVGIGVTAYSAGIILAHPYLAWPVGHALTYVDNHPYSPTMMAAYLICVGAPPLLSSSWALRLFGVIVATGLAISMLAFYQGFFSVWCFFAALASITLIGFFRTRMPAPSSA